MVVEYRLHFSGQIGFIQEGPFSIEKAIKSEELIGADEDTIAILYTLKRHLCFLCAMTEEDGLWQGVKESAERLLSLPRPVGLKRRTHRHHKGDHCPCQPLRQHRRRDERQECQIVEIPFPPPYTLH